MNTESAPAQESAKPEKGAKKPSEPRAAAPAPSPILGIAPNARAVDVDAAYKNYGAQVQARQTAATNIAQRDCSSEVQAHHRDHEEVRKYLKKSRTYALRGAQAAKIAALRKAQSDYDALVNAIETENTSAVTAASHKFNTAVSPIHDKLTERRGVIDGEAKKALSSAQAEFLVEKAAAEERARVAAEAAKVEAAKKAEATAAPVATATEDDEAE